MVTNGYLPSHILKREWNNCKLASDFASYIHYIHVLLACPAGLFRVNVRIIIKKKKQLHTER